MNDSQWDRGFKMQMFPEDWFAAIAVIPNLLLALSYQMNFFPIFKGMKNGNDKKMVKASLAGIAGCGISYLVVGMLGYSLYGDEKGFSANFLLSIEY